MLKITKTENDGSSQELTFESTTDAAKVLGALFGGRSASEIEERERRQMLNDELRRAFRAGKSADSIGGALRNAGY